MIREKGERARKKESEREREREREREGERERGGRQKTLSIWPSGEPARTHTHIHERTHGRTHDHTHAWVQTVLFSCFVLHSFHSHKQYLTNQHPDNTHTHTHTQEHTRIKHM